MVKKNQELYISVDKRLAKLEEKMSTLEHMVLDNQKRLTNCSNPIQQSLEISEENIQKASSIDTFKTKRLYL